MNFYALIGLLNAIIVSILGIFVYFKNRKEKINQSFAIFCFNIAAWSHPYFIWLISSNEKSALFWSRALMAGAIFIPASFFYFVLCFLNLFEKYKKILFISLVIFFIFFISNFTNLFVNRVEPVLFFKFWPKPGILFHPFLILWMSYFGYSNYLLFRAYKNISGIKKSQIKYILLGVIIGLIGACTNYFLWYNIPIPPVGNFLVMVFAGIIAYSIVKYRLMDINVAIGKTAVYLFSFATILALAFILFYLNTKLTVPLPIYIFYF